MSMLHENLNSEGNGEINILSAIATFLRRNLNRNQGYYESSLLAYSMRHRFNFYARNTCFHRAPDKPQILPTIRTGAIIMGE